MITKSYLVIANKVSSRLSSFVNSRTIALNFMSWDCPHNLNNYCTQQEKECEILKDKCVLVGKVKIVKAEIEDEDNKKFEGNV